MHVTLHLTTGCSMRCSYCYAPPHPGPRMTAEIARQAMELGNVPGEGCGVIFFGGEPLLCLDLIRQVIDEAHRLQDRGLGPFHFKLTTNGLALDDAALELCQRERIHVGFSCDGVAEAHDRHRRLPDGSPTWHLIEPRLRALLATNPYATVMTTVSPDTAALLPESTQWLVEEIGARYLVVSLDHAADWQEKDLRTLERSCERIARLYVRWTIEERKFYFSPFEIKLASHINRHCDRKDRCELAERQLSVAPDGGIYPCVQFVNAGEQWRIGHVATGMDEQQRQRVRALSSANKPQCAGCALEPRCHNTCGCLNHQTTGSLQEVSPVLCRHERMLFPIVDRLGAELYRMRRPAFLHKHYNAAYPILSVLEDHAEQVADSSNEKR